MKRNIKLTEAQLKKIVEALIESKDSEMSGTKSRSEYEPTPKESEIIAKLFGKYGEDIPPSVIRYLRKIGRKTLTKRLLDLELIDKSVLGDE